LRTSSSTNVGADKDSDKRQRAAIEAFAKHAGFEIVAELYDQAVSGADPIDARPAFAAMLEHIAGNGARTIIVETANRFARDRRSSTISEPPPLIAGRRPPCGCISSFGVTVLCGKARRSSRGKPRLSGGNGVPLRSRASMACRRLPHVPCTSPTWSHWQSLQFGRRRRPPTASCWRSPAMPPPNEHFAARLIAAVLTMAGPRFHSAYHVSRH